MSKLTIKEILALIDTGSADVWNELSAEQKKDVSFWLLNRYVSTISGTYEEQAMQVLKINEYYNKNWSVLGTKHPALQWQILCMINEDQKIKFHKWIGLKSKKDTNSKAVKLLTKLYPNMKTDEVETLARISTKSELKELAKAHGFEDKAIDL